MPITNELIKLCGKLSEEVYDNCTEVKDLGYSITHLADLTLVSIRGTSNARNAARDINVIPWKFGSFFSTWGFVRAFNKLSPKILKELGDNRKVIFTGHSLGGAVATLFAEKLGVGCVTFGAPRVYFKYWSFESSVDHVRIYMSDDPVASIPKLFYEHKCVGLGISDADSEEELFDVKDHSISYYNKFVVKNFSGLTMI